MAIADLDPYIKQHDQYLVANRFNHKPIPVYPCTSNPIKGDKAPHVMSYDEAEKLYELNIHDDLVFYYDDTCPLLVVDMDHCLQDGQLLPAFRAILDKHPTYTEISSSGNGLHAYYQCSLDEKVTIANKAIYYLYNPEDSPDNKAIKCEIIAKKHLCTLTGNTFENSQESGVRPLADLAITIATHCPFRPQSQQVNTHDTHATHNTDDVSMEDASDALYYLDPDMDHDTWVMIGMAIHSQWPNHNGKELFNIWSRQGKTYNNRDFHCTWCSFSDVAGGITIKSLFKEAVRQGYRRQKDSNVVDIKPKRYQRPDTRPHTTYPHQHGEEPLQQISPPVQFLSMKQILELPQPAWLTNTLIPARSVGQLFGATQTYKSFIALHLSLCMTQGLDFFGLPTRKGQVLYMCGERIEDFGKRILGWESHYTIPIRENPDIMFTRGCYDIASPYKNGQFLAYLQYLQQHKKFAPSLIIIDTLSKAFFRNENSTEDMGQFIKSLEAIRDITGATVLLVHHSGHSESTRARGSSRLPDDLDFCLYSERDDNVPYQTRLTSTKQKDAEIINPVSITMKQVDTERGNTLVATGHMTTGTEHVLPEDEQHYCDEPLRQDNIHRTAPPQPRFHRTQSAEQLDHKASEANKASEASTDTHAFTTLTPNQTKAVTMLNNMLATREKLLQGRSQPRVSIKDFKEACLKEKFVSYAHWSRFETHLLMARAIVLDGTFVKPGEQPERTDE